MDYIGFSFKNFKGIQELCLPLEGRGVTTLIGLNESGKTTILEAIFCFSYGAEKLDVLDPAMASLRDPERWIPIAERANFNKTIEIAATVRMSDEDVEALRGFLMSEFDLRLASCEREITVTERYFFANSRHLHEKNRKTWSIDFTGTKGRQRTTRRYNTNCPEVDGVIGFLKERLPRIWYFPNFLFELPDRFMLEEATQLATAEDSEKNEFYRLTFSKILDKLGTGTDLETHVVARLKSGDKRDKRSLDALLLAISREITTTIFRGWNRIFGKAPAAQEVELETDVDATGAAYAELKIKGPDGYYDLSERSLGFRWFFMFLLMTSYRGLDAGDRGVMFLLDEPASNLHSSAQAELLTSFETLGQTCRLIYTTHSHHLINLRWLDSAYVVRNSALGDMSFEGYMTQTTATRTSISATKYRTFVAENPSKTSYFQPVLDLLEYRPSDLEPVPNVVLVEGKSDFFILRYAIEVMKVASELRLVPGGGAGTLDTLIRLHIGWGKNFLILLDGDSEGLTQKDRYIREFGPLVEDRCLILGDLSAGDDVKEIEDLLTPNDKEELLKAVFPPHVDRPSPKKALLQAVTEMYGRREAVSLSEESIQRLTDVLRSLEATLNESDGRTV